MSQISHLIVLRLRDQLLSEMRTKIPSSDPTRAGDVQAYRFQESPLEPVNYLWVSSGNPLDPINLSARDGRLSARDMENLNMNIPDGEIGGGHYWWRKGRITLGCYFVLKNYKQEVAADYAHKYFGRAVYYAERTNVADLEDEFGERAYYLWVYASNFYEGGGPPAQYIWRGEIAWQVLTHRPY